MHHPAAAEAAPRPGKGWERAHTASRPYSAAERVPESFNAKSALDEVPGSVQTAASIATTDDFMLCTPALNSIRTAPWVTVLAAEREDPLTGTSGMFVYRLLSLIAVLSTGLLMLRLVR